MECGTAFQHVFRVGERGRVIPMATTAWLFSKLGTFCVLLKDAVHEIETFILYERYNERCYMKCVPNTLALHYKFPRKLTLSLTRASTFTTAQTELHTSTHTSPSVTLATASKCLGKRSKTSRKYLEFSRLEHSHSFWRKKHNTQHLLPLTELPTLLWWRSCKTYYHVDNNTSDCGITDSLISSTLRYVQA